MTWTRETVRETAAGFRELIFAWQWPASVLDLWDTPNERRNLRAMREQAQRTVDGFCHLAVTAAERDPADGGRYLGLAVTFWEGFEAQVDALERRADETVMETAQRFVADTAADVNEVAAGIGQGITDTARGVGAGLGFVLVGVAGLALAMRRR